MLLLFPGEKSVRPATSSNAIIISTRASEMRRGVMVRGPVMENNLNKKSIPSRKYIVKNF
jgi:hypothetical protein